MKNSTTAKRLAEYMRIYDMKQIDILEAAEPYCKTFGIKMNKSDISQYVNGKVEPGNDKIYVLSLALNVNPIWLMGYDVDMHDTSNQDNFFENQQKEQPAVQYDELDIAIASLVSKLTPKNRDVIMKLSPQNIDRLFGYGERLLEEQEASSSAQE